MENHLLILKEGVPSDRALGVGTVLKGREGKSQLTPFGDICVSRGHPRNESQ